MSNSVAFAVALDDILAVADTFVVADNSFVHTAAAVDIVGIVVAAVGTVAAVGIVAAAAGSSVVAHSTVVLDIAGTVVGFAGVYLHPCKRGPLLWTACKIAPSPSFQPPALPPRASLGA